MVNTRRFVFKHSWINVIQQKNTKIKTCDVYTYSYIAQNHVKFYVSSVYEIVCTLPYSIWLCITMGFLPTPSKIPGNVVLLCLHWRWWWRRNSRWPCDHSSGCFNKKTVWSTFWWFGGWYCWWKKSCTTLDVWNPVNNGIFTISTGAGFFPSTVWGLIFRHKNGMKWLRTNSWRPTQSRFFRWRWSRKDVRCSARVTFPAHLLLLFSNS